MAEVKNVVVDKYGISHRTIKVNGINMHIAEKGKVDNPVILFIHGFPELWYSWRHQITALADLGYHAVAPDMRGYGATDAPAEASAYTYCHTVGDLVALIDVLGADKVFVVGHDWGAAVAWHLCLFRPDRVRAVVNLSTPFMPRDPSRRPIESLRDGYGDDLYICRFQVPGEMEAEVDIAGDRVEKFLQKIFTMDAEPLFLRKGEWYNELLPALPPWLSQEEFLYYVDQFKQNGFTGGFNYYRAMDLNWEITSPWNGAQVKVPAKFIVGDMDPSYHFPGMKDSISNGGMQKFVPGLEEVVVMEGAGHFIQQEKADEVNKHIYDFFFRKS